MVKHNNEKEDRLFRDFKKVIKAFTRAKKQLILIGSIKSLKTIKNP